MFGKPNGSHHYRWDLPGGKPLPPLLSFLTLYPSTQTHLLMRFSQHLLAEPAWLEAPWVSVFQKGRLQCNEMINKLSYLAFATELVLSAVTLTFGWSSRFHTLHFIVLFLIRNLSNRSVHLSMTRNNSRSQQLSVPLFPPVLQQLRSCFQVVHRTGRIEVSLPVSA